MHYFLLVIACTVATVAAASSDRQGKRIRLIQRLTSHSKIAGVNYQLCEKEGITGACLPTAICQQQGKFIGYCGDTKTYCCKVSKTCGGTTTSHHAIFKNPNYPERDSEARVCNLKVDIGKEVCAVRLNFDVFLLAPYESGVCIRDTLTVLGSQKYPVTPVCGNMTNWATTFAVDAGGQVTLAMVLQGMPKYKFYIRVTQLPCSKITPFQSPTYSGVRNEDAPSYTPTTTPAPTKAPETTTTDIPTEDPTTTFTEMDTEVPTTTPAATTTTPATTTTTPATTTTTPATTTTTPAATTTTPATTTTTPATTTTTPAATTTTPAATTTTPAASTATETGPTTLQPGKIPVPKHDKVIINSPYEEQDYIAEEGVDSVPSTSAFKRAFEMKVNDKCWQYESESDTGFRIIGGSYTNINEYPWQVGLVYKGKFFCGGSIISDRHILTASHCVFGSFSKGIHMVLVTMGDHDLSTRNETNHTVGRVKSINWNIHYNPHSTKNDIAILELQEPIEFDYSKIAVRLPTDLDERYENANATVTGWGRFNITTKKTSAVLKEYTGPVLNSIKCVLAWNKFPGIDAELLQHICLDVSIGTPCHGDSGGPLVVCSGSHCTQVGVVSFGFPLCTNVGLPAVFARLTYFKPWLDMTTHSPSVLHV